MKFCCVFVLAIAANVATGIPVEEPTNGRPGSEGIPRFLEFEGEDGQIIKIDLEEQSNMELLSKITKDNNSNKYFLFTRDNPDVAHALLYRSPETIQRSSFAAWKPTVVTAHGWLGNQNNGYNTAVRDAYLENHDVNVIVLDWRSVALAGYVSAASGVLAIGRELGQFLQWLHDDTGLQFKNVHLVGFSLGAHLVGNAGRSLGGQIGRITGLDPAGPLWTLSSKRLTPNDAIYVEAIHTNGELQGLGIGTEVADADFFPNGGKSQPGCLTSICDHNK